MSWMAWTLARTWRLLRPEPLAQDLDEQLQSHLEMLIDENLERGMAPEQARREALLTLGNRDTVRDEYLQTAGIPSIEHLVFDTKMALICLRKSPGFTGAAILALSTGILVASVICAIAFSPRVVPGYGPNARDVYVLSDYARNHLGEWNKFEISIRSSPAEYESLRNRAKSFRELALANQLAVILETDDRNVTVSAARVTAGFFPLLRAQAALGRTFDSAHEQDDRQAVVISDGIWKSRFHSDGKIVGRTLTIDKQKVRVIGVTPPEFSFPAGSEMWFVAPVPTAEPEHSWHRWDILARLAPGIAVRAAETEINAIIDTAAGDQQTRNWRIGLESLPKAYGGSRSPFAPAIAVAVVVLLISWLNVTTLLSARVISRRNEFAIRVALGASRARIMRQIGMQTFLIAAAVCASVVPLAMLISPRILSWLNQTSLGLPQISRQTAIQAGLWAAALALLSAIACGIGPAFQAARLSILTTSGTATVAGAHGRWRHRHVRLMFAISQIAFALVLFVGAGQMLKTFFFRWLTFNHDHSGNTLLVTLVSVNNAASMPRTQINSLYEDALREAQSLRGVRSASIASLVPFYNLPAIGRSVRVEAPSLCAEPYPAVVQSISPAYLQQMSIRLVQGRSLSDQDAHGAPVAIINESLARRCFGSGDALGQHIRLEDEAETSKWMIIVGIVRDANISPLSSGPELTVYRPFQQEILTAKQINPRCMILRTTGEAQAYATGIRDHLATAFASLKFYRAESLERTLVRTHKQDWYTSKVLTALLAVMSAVGILLAAIGVYSLLRHWAIDRRRETAIRLATGATRRHIILTSLKNAGALFLAGNGIGLPLAIVLAEILRSVLMVPIDKSTFVLCSATLGAIVLAATYIPARSASKTDPMSILRWE